MNRSDTSREVASALVMEVVAGYCSDDDMAKRKPGDGIGETIGLVNGGGVGSGGFHRTVMAPAGAFVAEDHERGVPPGPALRKVWAPGVLTDGCHAAFGDDVGGVRKIAGRQRPLEPGRKPALRCAFGNSTDHG